MCLSRTTIHPLRPLSQVARFPISSINPKKYSSQLGLFAVSFAMVIFCVFLYPSQKAFPCGAAVRHIPVKLATAFFVLLLASVNDSPCKSSFGILAIMVLFFFLIFPYSLVSGGQKLKQLIAVSGDINIQFSTVKILVRNICEILFNILFFI